MAADPLTTSWETLKKAASGMQRKAAGAQRPRHINEIGEGAKTKFRRRLISATPMLSRVAAAEANTAQRSDAPAQQFIQRFP